MSGGDEILDFEEQKFDELVEGFIKKFQDEWDCYVHQMWEEAWQDYEPDEDSYPERER